MSHASRGEFDIIDPLSINTLRILFPGEFAYSLALEAFVTGTPRAHRLPHFLDSHPGFEPGYLCYHGLAAACIQQQGPYAQEDSLYLRLHQPDIADAQDRDAPAGV
jgi:hypothetical protein